MFDPIKYTSEVNKAVYGAANGQKQDIFTTEYKTESKMNEIWREIKGFEGLYDISNCGRVRSRERMVYQEKRKPYLKPEKITYGSVVNGRLMFLLVRDSKERKNCFVHRLFLKFAGNGLKVVTYIILMGIRTIIWPII